MGSPPEAQGDGRLGPGRDNQAEAAVGGGEVEGGRTGGGAAGAEQEEEDGLEHGPVLVAVWGSPRGWRWNRETIPLRRWEARRRLGLPVR